MGFIQIIEFRSSKLDEMREVGEQFEAAVAERSKVRRRVLCEDHDHPGHFFNIVSFDSYEEAMENSGMPETQEFAQKMMALGDGPPTFYNLDVIDEVG